MELVASLHSDLRKIMVIFGAVDRFSEPMNKTIRFGMTNFVDSNPSDRNYTRFAELIETYLGIYRRLPDIDEKYTANAWINTRYHVCNSSQVEISLVGLLVGRTSSNGLPCNLAVYAGELEGHKIALKFREWFLEQDAQVRDLSENEAKNALKTDCDDSIRDLFPQLHCVVDIHYNIDRRNHRWELIGTQLLSKPSRSFENEDAFWVQCCDLLVQLHAAGKVHGDSHVGNFMVGESTYQHGGDFYPKVLMIDQDELEDLPDNGTSVLSKYLQILDFHELLYWCNPHCDPFQRSGHHVRRWQGEICKKYSPSLLHTPYGFFRHRKALMVDRDSSFANAATRHAEIMREISDGSTRIGSSYDSYAAFLESKSVSDINKCFVDVFSSIGSIYKVGKRVQDQIEGLGTSNRTSCVGPMLKLLGFKKR